MIFRKFSAFSGFSLHGNPILSSDLVLSSNFTSIIEVVLAPGRCPQTRERFSYNGFSILRFFEFSAFSCSNRGKLTPGSCLAGKITSILYFWVFFEGDGLPR